MTITAEHSSLLHSVEPATLRAALTKQLADEPDFLSLTEMMSEARAAVLDEFLLYDVARVSSPVGADECAAMVLRERFRIISVRVVRLSDLPIPRRGDKFDYALVVALEDVLTGERHTRIIVHRPSGVEGADGLRDNAQAACYRGGTGGLRRLVASIDGPLVITGDWNLSLRRPWVRRYLELHFPAFTPTWSAGNLPELGTHGARVIDFSLVRSFTVTAAQVGSSFGASDHRAIRETHKEIPVMANRYPAASFEPLGRQTEERMTSHDIFCIHTMAGSLAGTDAMFERDGFGGTESHWGTGGAGEKVKQWQDMAFTADANLDGNPRVLSVENADRGPGFPDWSGSNVPAFTAAQLDDLVDLGAWVCSKEAHSACPPDWKCHQVGIPAALIPDTKPGRRGIGYHRQGIDGSLPDMRVSGGEKWSEARGKICPGDARVWQTKHVLIPRIQARLNSQEDEVTKEDIAAIAKAVQRIVLMGQDDAPDGRYLGATLTGIHDRLLRVEAKLDKLLEE